MGKWSQIAIQSPLKGLDRRGAYRQQAPYSTPDALNVRPFSTLEGRERVGSRPGLEISHATRLGTSPIRMMANMEISADDGRAVWVDTFSGLSLADAWTQAAWAAAAPGILATMQASVDYDLISGAAVRDLIDINTASRYIVEMYVCPNMGAHHGKYRIFARMDNSTPNVETDGIAAELVMTGSTGAYSGSLAVTVSGTTTTYAFTAGTNSAAVTGWFSVVIVGDNVKCYWRGTLLLDQTISTQPGKRIGFGMECTEAGGICLVNTFRVQYVNPLDAPLVRSLLVASSAGLLYREVERGWMEQVSTSATLRSDVALQAVQRGQKLYIADYGLRVEGNATGTANGTTLTASGVSDWTAYGIEPASDVAVISDVAGSAVAGTYRISSVSSGGVTLAASAGSGSCSFRIERAPKVYDPLVNTLTVLTASVGQVPSGCPCIARFRDRIVLAGADYAPHVWYMSRQQDATDWDYAAESADTQMAVAGTSSDAGTPGEPITALIQHSDDYLLIGCENSFWIMRGDPADSGTLDNLSRTIGTVSSQAWTLGPSGEAIFLTRDGVYMLAAGGTSYPVSVSRERLPQELVNIVTSSTTVLLEFDVRDRGVHVYLTPESPNDRIHWWMDWERKSFWPVSLQGNHEPTGICRLVTSSVEDTGVILGCRDGWLRRYSGDAVTDCGTAFESYVVHGPIALGDDYQEGKLTELRAVVAEKSGNVAWSVTVGNTYEAAVSGATVDSGTWDEGENYADRPDGVRGMAFTLKVAGIGLRWAMERITAITRLVGRQKLL